MIDDINGAELEFRANQKVNDEAGPFFRYRSISLFDDGEEDYRVVVAAVRKADIYCVGFAFCSPNDLSRFCKRTARTIATGRLSTERTGVLLTQQEVDTHKGVFNAAMEKALNLPEKPRWFPVELWNTFTHTKEFVYKNSK